MTIYALSSGPGISGVAVIRISGEKTKDVIKQITGRKLPKPRMASLNKIIEIKTKELIDEGIVIWFPGPNSYTGEDMAEIHVHGSRAVIKSILDNISKINSCRLAEPGEFTKIAFQNEKIMVRVMKKGSRIMLTGYNEKGSQTIDHYSLLGFTKAYNTAKKACS